MFSVVIPLYNKELSIKNTIQSVLNQSYQNFEIIVINDGSTDESAKIVETISDERIRLIQQKNQGVSAARNRGIQEASNEWIAFLDGDDIWSQEHLQEITIMMRKFPEEKIFVTSFEYSDKRPMFRHPRKEAIFKIDNYFKDAIKEYLMWTSIVVVHKSCFKKIGGFNEKLNRGEDLDLWVRLVRNYNIIKSIKITAIYKIDAENRTYLSKDLKKTFTYNLNFDLNNSKDEDKYYKDLILKRCYEYALEKDFKSIKKFKKKYPEINLNDVFLFILRKTISRIKTRNTKIN